MKCILDPDLDPGYYMCKRLLWLVSDVPAYETALTLFPHLY